MAADAVVLPGVGSFNAAMDEIAALELKPLLDELALRRKKPFLGICLGMQLISEESVENGLHRGLGWLPGRVEMIPATESRRVPHVGWRRVTSSRHSPLFERIPDGGNFYFDHSYHLVTEDDYVEAVSDYKMPLTVAVRRDNIFGVQFHPEKSQIAGMKLLRGFLNYVTSASLGTSAHA